MTRTTVVSRKDALGLEGQAELLHEARRTRSRARLSRDSIRERRALRTVPPEREEHILAQLVGISTDQTRMWPEIARLLEEAQIKDWSRPLVVVPPDGEAKNLKVQTFGSFEAVYAELVEPWCGADQGVDRRRTGRSGSGIDDHRPDTASPFPPRCAICTSEGRG
jgi:hypothetical protein